MIYAIQEPVTRDVAPVDTAVNDLAAAARRDGRVSRRCNAGPAVRRQERNEIFVERPNHPHHDPALSWYARTGRTGASAVPCSIATTPGSTGPGSRNTGRPTTPATATFRSGTAMPAGR